MVATASASYRIEKPRNPENWRKIGQKKKILFLPIFLQFSVFWVFLFCSWPTRSQEEGRSGGFSPRQNGSLAAQCDNPPLSRNTFSRKYRRGGIAPIFRDRKGAPKNLCDKDFAELSGELSGAICLKPLFLFGSALDLFRK